MRVHSIIAGAICIIVLFACAYSEATPDPVVRSSEMPMTATMTPSPSPEPTPTLPPTATATPTTVPSPTPTPTETPIIISVPVLVDLQPDAEEGRPLISGNVRFVDTEIFRIFYTLAGEDAVIVADENGNAIPDYVELVAEALHHAWQVEVEQLGWHAPPPDENLGGDARYDVYLKDLDWGYIGFARADQYFYHNGDNPNSAPVENNAISSHMVIDNDFVEYSDSQVGRAAGEEGKADTDTGDRGMRISIAHELMHMIQYGYDAYEDTAWLWESTASWAERMVYPDQMERMDDLGAAFQHPDICQLAYGRDDSAGHWYSEWLFIHFLAEKYGSDLIRSIWEQTVQHDGYAAIEMALTAYDTTILTEMQEYHLAVLISNFGFDVWTWSVRLEGVVENPQVFRPATGVGQMGADYIRIATEGVVDIRLHQLAQGVFIGVRGDSADVYFLNDRVVSVDTGQYQLGYVVVMNLEQANDIDSCAYFPYQLSVSRGKEASAPDSSKAVSAPAMPLE